ncbi:MAG: phosphatase PAP2 family protein [Thermomicrobiales bacterium]
MSGRGGTHGIARMIRLSAVTCAALACGFALVADEVVDDGRDRYDRALDLTVHATTGPALTSPVRVATELGATATTAAACLVTAGWLLARGRRWRAALALGASWCGGQVAVALLKHLLHRPRPDLFPPLVHAYGYSFPSGHTFSAVVAYGLLAAFVAERLTGRRRIIPPLAAAAVVGAVGFSRVYLGAHYPADVLGSLLLGGAWLSATLAAVRIAEEPGTTIAAFGPVRTARRTLRHVAERMGGVRLPTRVARTAAPGADAGRPGPEKDR